MSLLQATAQSLLLGLVEPTVFLPAIAIGLIARRWWQLLVACVVLAALLLALSRTALPEGAEIVWFLAPLGLLAPLIWASVTFQLRAWYRRGNNQTARRTIGTFAGLIIGAACGGALFIGLGLLTIETFRVSNFEGAAGYMVVFLFLPAGLLVGGALGAWLGWRRARRPAPPSAGPA